MVHCGQEGAGGEQFLTYSTSTPHARTQGTGLPGPVVPPARSSLIRSGSGREGRKVPATGGKRPLLSGGGTDHDEDMLSPREILRRFRPAGAPGAAAPAGVPADRQAERERELLPVLALLEEAEQEAERIRQDGHVEAAARHRAGQDRADAVVANAQARAGSVRAGAAAAARADVVVELGRAVTAAQEAAEQTKERARARMPRLVDQAVALALAALDDPPDPQAGR